MEYIEVGALDALPTETGKVVRVGAHEVAIFRVGDEAFAIENECPHREGPLGEGELDGDVVTCPFHAWQVNVRTGQVVYNETLCSQTYPCKIEGGIVYLGISQSGE